MKIAIVGYGKMGKEIERFALERGHTISAKIDIGDAITAQTLNGASCAIEFSIPKAVVENITALARSGCNVVVGTTGWYEQLNQVRAIVQERNIGLLYSPNFSIGVNFFFHIVRTAAKLFNVVDGYDVSVHELHHKMKIDSPSGTALKIAQLILDEFKQKKEIQTETSHGTIRPEQLHVSSTRVGSVIGKHEVLFDSALDSIEITHTVKQRSALASGAILAAEWLDSKKGIYTFDDVLQTLTSH